MPNQHTKKNAVKPVITATPKPVAETPVKKTEEPTPATERIAYIKTDIEPIAPKLAPGVEVIKSRSLLASVAGCLKKNRAGKVGIDPQSVSLSLMEALKKELPKYFSKINF